MPIEKIISANKEIILVGTAHVSRNSVEEVCDAIAAEQPDIVAVELCQGRYDTIRNPQLWREMDIVRVIREKKTGFLFANLVMASFQKRIGSRLGVKPGEEMIAAIRAAEENNLPVALIDRPIQITLQRAWRGLSVREKMSLIWTSLTSIFAAEDFDEDQIEVLKEKDILTAAIDEIGKEAPNIKRVLIDERDAYMAAKLTALAAGRPLAVVGAGHLQGMKASINAAPADIAALEWIPPQKKSRAKWIVPAAIFALVAAGFICGSPEQGVEMITWWLISNAACAALGALLAWGHPLTILVAGLASPITSLNPTLAAGWFAGLTEAYLRKPTVADFETLPADTESLGGFWRNPITHILLVVILANLGSSMGALIAMPILTKIMLAG